MLRRFVPFSLLAFLAIAPLARADCRQGSLPGGALALYCVPAVWNGDLLVYAHGYVAASEPVGLAHLTLPDGTSLPDFVQTLGYAFATTSYRVNGLAVLDGVEDVQQLVAAFPQVSGRAAGHAYLVGVSEGGAVAALAAERSTGVFSGALALCGPYGDFRRQVDYVGDFRVVFDYFFPGILPGSPVEIPEEAMANWPALSQAAAAAVAARPDAAAELLAVVGAPSAAVGSAAETVQAALWYNIFASNDARAKLGGNPYDNRSRAYAGSRDDPALNASVARFGADGVALAALEAYQTTGSAPIPLVLMHTTSDPVVPYAQATLYAGKATAAGSRVTLMPVERYGHCAFTSGELLFGFAVVVGQAETR